jgi:hypothetical protein
MIVESRWNVDWQGKPKFSEKTCPSATFVHHKIPHTITASERAKTVHALDRSATVTGIYSEMPGENQPHIRGVEILINKNILDALLEWKPVSERINTEFRKMSVVQCYAPTENAKETLYNRLDRTLLLRSERSWKKLG